MKTISANEKICAEYEQSGKDIYMFRQEQNTITRGDKNSGYFSVTSCVFIPKINQAQIVFRYNNSTIRALASDYGLSEVPDRADELYDVTLLLAIDLTPNDESDNAGNDPQSVRFVRVHPSAYSRDTKLMYNYFRYTFDIESEGEDISTLLDSGHLLAVYADVYYKGDLNYENTPYGTLCLYDYKSENIPVELKSKDVKALKNYDEE